MPDTYAPINNSLIYNNPRNDNIDAIPNEPYNVSDDYYTLLVMKEWQADPSKVASLYFSVTNIKRLQKQIKKEIYNRSYSKFRLLEDQSVLDLLQAMRAVYKMYAKDLPERVIKQVKLLNKQTVQYVAPDIIDALKQHYGYLDDIKNPITPIQLPVNVNNSGRIQLPSISQLYGL
tara:strand:+ start:25 stop:549 length:525 start_codon:yes stop_codon:yes gene_type:complete